MKTSQELTGIANSLDDILLEMLNNRVDSVDRSERIANGVRDPINAIVQGSLNTLLTQVKAIEATVADPKTGIIRTAEAVSTAEDVILQLNTILLRHCRCPQMKTVSSMVMLWVSRLPPHPAAQRASDRAVSKRAARAAARRRAGGEVEWRRTPIRCMDR